MFRSHRPTNPFLIIILCVVLPYFTYAQRTCGFDTRLTESDDPTQVAILENILQQSKGKILSRETKVLPIVFHVVYSSSEENISDLQIQSQIDILNRDFAYMSENAPWVPDEFKSLGGDSGIRFCLASGDPDGNPTNGITRTQTSREFIGSHRQANGRYSMHYDIYGGKDGWDPDRYINVWVGNIEGLLGSATFPGMAPHPEEDGVIIDPEFVGALGLAAHSDPFDRGHTLTHELGHYFGLYHIWGEGSGGCNTDDYVEDTPEQESPYLGCPDYPQFSCGSSDMFMNFMDFTDDHCLALFTQGQIARMQAVLMGLRSSLLDSDVCAPIDTAQFTLDKVVVFASGGQLIFRLDQENYNPIHLTLFTVDGRTIKEDIWKGGELYWTDMASFPPGVYIIQLYSGTEIVEKKVVVAN